MEVFGDFRFGLQIFLLPCQVQSSASLICAPLSCFALKFARLPSLRMPHDPAQLHVALRSISDRGFRPILFERLLMERY